MTESEIEALMRAALAGDAGAYRTALSALVPHLRRMAFASLPPQAHANAEDVVQETLLVLHLKRASWDQTRPLLAWLRVILRHKAVDLLRRMRVADPIDDHAATLAAPVADPTEGYLVEQLLGMAPPRDAALIRAQILEGRDQAEVARDMNLSPGAMRVALHRALRRLAGLAQARDLNG